MPHNMKDLFKTYRDMHLQEVKQKEVDSLKKLSKDMQAVLKGYQKIARMGDKELTNMKYNKDYEAVLKARDVILTLIGKVNTQKILNKEETVKDLDEAPKMKKISIYGSEISGLKRSNGSKLGTYTAKPVILKGKLAFRVQDDSGSFETLDLKSFAKMYG